MTPLLIQNLTQLHAASTDEGDRALLGAILAANEAAEAEPADETQYCVICNDQWAPSLLDEMDRCPHCKLVIMHDYFHRSRWDYAAMEGWSL